MATITSAGSGNFSAGATWVGGVVPGAADDAVAATGHTVVIDTNTTVESVSQAGTGKFQLPGGVTLTGNVTINAGTVTSGGTVEVTATAGQTATITGAVSGASSTLITQAGVVVTGLGALIINGAVTGTAGNVADNGISECAAVYTNVASSITVNGAVTAGGTRKYGVWAGASSATASLTINGDATAGGGGGSVAVMSYGASVTIAMTGNATGSSTSAAVQATGSSATITITGNVTTGAGGVGASTTGASAAITITGNVTGGSGSNTYGVQATGASATVTVTGGVTGGGGTNAHGVYCSGATSLATVIGTVTAANTTGNGIRSDATSSGYGVVVNGSMLDSAGGVTAIWSRFFRLAANANASSRYANTSNFPNGGFLSRVSPDNVTGMPTVGNVRYATVYGYNSELTGTLRVPPANSVASGVPVDNTTGLAALSPADVAALVGAQIAAALNSTP